MPESRPLSTLTPADYDYPPASSARPNDASLDVPTRLGHLRRALQSSRDQAREVSNIVAAEWADRRSRDFLPPIISRRRRRSSSAHADGDSYSNGNTDRDPSFYGVPDAHRRHKDKRRRLSTTPPVPSKPAFKYGHYGQVEPGRLKMAVLSCDGGIHIDSRSTVTHMPESILRHDKSVYCSRRSMCNIILEHHDETSFCLEKLHITGPEAGFTAPVRKGVVYVSMSLPELQRQICHLRGASGEESPRTAYVARRIGEQYTPTHQSPPPHDYIHPHDRIGRYGHPAPSDRLTLSGALRDPEINAVMEHRERDDAISRALRTHHLAAEVAHYNPEPFPRRIRDHADTYWPPAPAPDDAYHDPDNVPAVTLLSDPDPGPEDPSAPAVLSDRQHRLRAHRRAIPEPPQPLATRLASPSHLSAHDIEARPSRSSTRPSEPAHVVHLPATANGSGGTTMVSFAIPRGRHSVALCFDPPVSGRFVLLKLWGGRNVDVQSVLAVGFAGPRFFPARGLRG